MATLEEMFGKSLKNAEISESLFVGLLPRRSFYQDELFKIKSFGVRALNRNKTKKTIFLWNENDPRFAIMIFLNLTIFYFLCFFNGTGSRKSVRES